MADERATGSGGPRDPKPARCDEVGLRVLLPPDRAFLVRLDADVDPVSGGLFGRVEHLESGKRASFSSTQELGNIFREFLLKENSQHKNGHSRIDGSEDPVNQKNRLTTKGVRDNDY